MKKINYAAKEKQWKKIWADAKKARKRLMSKKSNELSALAREVGIESIILDPVDEVFIINEPPFSIQKLVIVFKDGRRFAISATPSIYPQEAYLTDDWCDRRSFSADMNSAYNEWQSLVKAALPAADKNQKEFDERMEELTKDPVIAERMRINRESWDKIWSSLV